MKVDINDLEKLELIGNGVSGQVYRACSKKHDNKFFALKIIQLKDNNDKLKNLISNEVSTLHECKCENIVKCYASFYTVLAIL